MLKKLWNNIKQIGTYTKDMSNYGNNINIFVRHINRICLKLYHTYENNMNRYINILKTVWAIWNIWNRYFKRWNTYKFLLPSKKVIWPINLSSQGPLRLLEHGCVKYYILINYCLRRNFGRLSNPLCPAGHPAVFHTFFFIVYLHYIVSTSVLCV